MRPLSCSTCRALHQLLVKAEPDVVRRGVDARTRGPGWGVLVALPEELGAETDEEAAQLEAARERGDYVGVMPTRTLMEMVPGRGHHPEAVAGILRQLSRPAPDGQVHVLGTLDRCVAAVPAYADPVLAAATRAVGRLRSPTQRGRGHLPRCRWSTSTPTPSGRRGG